MIIFKITIALIILLIVIKSLCRLPLIKGIIGERKVRKALGKTVENKQYVINNLVIDDDNMSRQIDHITITHSGIYVIETKNYSGRIYGSANQMEWTQVLQYGKVKQKFYNPLKQNNSHVYVISKLLPVYLKNSVKSLVVFTKANIDNVNINNVTNIKGLKKIIKNNTFELSNEMMKEAYYIIMNSKSNKRNKAHVNDINKMINNIDKGICPRCGGKLTKRNGKFGVFFGCENYPKCEFIKK